MARNIIICCDGTTNQPSKDQTNVAKLIYALEKDSARQLVYYHPGLGTMAAPGYTTKLGSVGARTAGLAFGAGLKDDLRDAYAYIMNHWQSGDRLYLFGFSRGAYTVRALASLIRMYGIAMTGNDPLIPYAVRMMWQAHLSDDAFKKAIALANQFKASLTLGDCPIHFLGVWDTVSSVGWVGSPVSFPYTHANDAVASVRHAVSIDEHRAFFRTNLFGQTPGQDLLQVWFPGEHSDVGGGYPERDSGMSKYPLEWMATEAIGKGLLVNEDRLQEVLGNRGSNYAKARPGAALHNSMTSFWPLLEFAPKKHWNAKTGKSELRCNLFRRRDMGVTPIVHDVAWLIPGYSTRLPPGAVPLARAHQDAAALPI